MIKMSIMVNEFKYSRLLLGIQNDSGNKLDNLIEHPYLKCEPDDIVHLYWSTDL